MTATCANTQKANLQQVYFKIRILFILSAISYVCILTCFLFAINVFVNGNYSDLKCHQAHHPPGNEVDVANGVKIIRERPKRSSNNKIRHGRIRRQGPQEGFRWLNSYSRIPDSALQEFCVKSYAMCNSTAGPPGPKGLKGFKGNKGDQGAVGETGLPGKKGPEGIPGLTGIRGPPGESGIPGVPGTPGLDGRDGIPGEPGLDGVPGKNGHHGRSGSDGRPGIDGIPGRNGTNGIPGIRGPPGLNGPKGPPGLPGPRGRKGSKGDQGSKGLPGSVFYKYENDTLATPPTIIVPDHMAVLSVIEDEHVEIRCEAVGTPPPKVVWSRTDNKFINMKNGIVLVNAISSATMKIGQVSRQHIGEYICHASNGIRPMARKRIQLDVIFPPLIKIRNQHLGATIGGHAVFTCNIEVYPTAVNYWIRGDGIPIDPSWKYLMNETTDGYKVKLILNITNIRNSDFGMYACVSKNVRGKTRGTFTLFNQTELPDGSTDNDKIYIYGKEPLPRKVVKECPPCECDEILPLDCESARGAIIKNMIDKDPDIMYKEGLADTKTWVKQARRKRQCLLYQIGKPVFLRDSVYDWGSFMLDAGPRNSKEDLYWSTDENRNNLLFEYKDKKHFRTDNVTKTYTLKRSFKGNGHVVYNKAFYYHQASSTNITRRDLGSNKTMTWKVENMEGTTLYKSKHVSMDFMTDENGLWMVYGCQFSNNTMVMKVNPYNLLPEKIWNLTLDRQNYGEMFIICGILYAVDSVTDIMTTVSVAIDLYDLTKINPKITWTNPYQRTTMVSYNHRSEFLYSWDKGNQLEYILRLNSN